MCNIGRNKWDVIIIGAGIAGASCGYFLAKDQRVLLLERESQPGYHTTGRSAAFFAETYGNATICALSKMSHHFFATPPDSFTDVPLWHPLPILQGGRVDQIDRIDTLYKKIANFCDKVDLIDGNTAESYLPILRKGYIAKSILDNNGHEIDVHALHQGFLSGLVRYGSQVLCNAEVTALSYDGSSWTVKTQAGTFNTPIVVNAAGAWGDVVGSLAGAKACGLIPKRRTVIVFDIPGGNKKDWGCFIDIDEQFYIKPESGGGLASPCDETPMAPCDVQPTELDIAIAVEQLEKTTNLRIRSIRRKWAGLRSFVADQSPVVGFDPKCKGFFWLIGQGGCGIMTSPALGRLSAMLICNKCFSDDDVLGESKPSIDALSPKRLSSVKRNTNQFEKNLKINTN